MQTIAVRTTQNVYINYPLASLGDRIGAYFIDQLIIGIFAVAIFALFTRIDMTLWWVWLIAIGFPYLFYSLVFELILNGQTPGKMALKIKVVRMDGTPATVGDYLLRWIFSFVDIFILSGAIALIAIAAGGKGQRLGDMVAGTTVVKLAEQKEITAKDLFITTESDYKPVFPEAANLSPREIELIQQALEMNKQYANDKALILVTEKVKKLLMIETDLPPVKFLYTIIRDYNHITSQVA